MFALNSFMLVKYRAQIKIKFILSRFSYLTNRRMMVLEEKEEEKDNGEDEALASASNSSENTAKANDR